ncbi:MAG: UDP-N-acetylglucosamine 2-epimerase (non-hydrolyzing) [Bryobacteraceae bacterium]
MNLQKILFVFGTRPEAIKLCPVVGRLRSEPEAFAVKICATAQHRELLDQVLAVFDVRPDYDLDAMRPGQSLTQATSRILVGLEGVLRDDPPDWVVVQGDTTSTLCGALAAFYAGIRVAHVEAGLRTGDPRQPFPEEMNRVMTARIATLHFAATEWAQANLLREGVLKRDTLITGNTGIDSVLSVRRQLESGTLAGGEWPWLDRDRKLILVTAHRRESFGPGFEHICEALTRLAARPDVQIVYPVHPNPRVTEPVRRHLAGLKNVVLLEPLDYVSFVDLMRRAWLLLTDSGGVQEEGPSLGKPILVLREKTERPEAVEAGTVRLVGTDPARIIAETVLLLEDEAEYARRSQIHNPYGDGRASERIACALREYSGASESDQTLCMAAGY